MIYSIDIESTGLNPYLGDRAFLITWCDEEGKTGSCRWGIDDAMLLNALTVDSRNEWVGHNLSFDLAFLNKMGFDFNGTLHDTLIAAHLFNPLEPTKALKALTAKYLGRENKEAEKLENWFASNGMRGKDNREYIKVPEEIILPYALADVSMTMDLWKWYKAKGIIDSSVYKFECSLIPVCVDIVRQGMKVDKLFVRSEAERTTNRATELGFQANNQFGIMNLGSDEQIADLLFKQAGLECKLRTDKGNPQLDDIALQEYDHPIVPLVREYRDMVKMNSTYLQPMLYKTDEEDRIHASLNQTGARTGRFSSSNPNLQNIPRSGGAVDIRRGFITKDGDHQLLLIDLSQIELRVLAHYCQEGTMLETLRRRDGDLHADTAQAMFGSVEKKYRTIAKTLNFAVIYGAGAKKLRDTLNRALPGAQFTLEQTKEFKRTYFEKFPQVREFLTKVECFVRERGMKDRVGYVDGLSKRRYFCEVDKAYRIANYLIQGESAMFFKSKMLAIQPLLKGKQTKLINVVHDEMIFDLHRSESSIIPELLLLIEDLHMFRVPIYANAAISETNWAEKKGISLDLLGISSEVRS